MEAQAGEEVDSEDLEDALTRALKGHIDPGATAECRSWHQQASGSAQDRIRSLKDSVRAHNTLPPPELPVQHGLMMVGPPPGWLLRLSSNARLSEWVSDALGCPSPDQLRQQCPTGCLFVRRAILSSRQLCRSSRRDMELRAGGYPVKPPQPLMISMHMWLQVLAMEQGWLVHSV